MSKKHKNKKSKRGNVKAHREKNKNRQIKKASVKPTIEAVEIDASENTMNEYRDY